MSEQVHLDHTEDMIVEEKGEIGEELKVVLGEKKQLKGRLEELEEKMGVLEGKRRVYV